VERLPGVAPRDGVGPHRNRLRLGPCGTASRTSSAVIRALPHRIERHALEARSQAHEVRSGLRHQRADGAASRGTLSRAARALIQRSASASSLTEPQSTTGASLISHFTSRRRRSRAPHTKTIVGGGGAWGQKCLEALLLGLGGLAFPLGDEELLGLQHQHDPARPPSSATGSRWRSARRAGCPRTQPIVLNAASPRPRAGGTLGHRGLLDRPRQRPDRSRELAGRHVRPERASAIGLASERFDDGRHDGAGHVAGDSGSNEVRSESRKPTALVWRPLPRVCSSYSSRKVSASLDQSTSLVRASVELDHHRERERDSGMRAAAR
jgi:hypothetical protein